MKGNRSHLNDILSTSQCNWRNRTIKKADSLDTYKYKYGKYFHE